MDELRFPRGARCAIWASEIVLVLSLGSHDARGHLGYAKSMDLLLAIILSAGAISRWPNADLGGTCASDRAAHYEYGELTIINGLHKTEDDAHASVYALTYEDGRVLALSSKRRSDRGILMSAAGNFLEISSLVMKPRRGLHIVSAIAPRRPEHAAAIEV